MFNFSNIRHHFFWFNCYDRLYNHWYKKYHKNINTDLFFQSCLFKNHDAVSSFFLSESLFMSAKSQSGDIKKMQSDPMLIQVKDRDYVANL